MNIFTVTIIQGQYEDRTERVLIFSSLEKALEWKENYKTSNDSFYCNGKEYAIISEIEIDTNKLISISEMFYLDADKTSIHTPTPEEDLAALAELKQKLTNK